ncbi:hypothetical protein M9H77_28678 [Catharanthus roseus]|uniref:Uncharacterized protein n=1 Tax=Catharanthus roseus TaxID=4058 RepID=A0ACC0AHZ5_CATRO|nr:hypothetical protein M9H77_28678 [Catharanthus roseus]
MLPDGNLVLRNLTILNSNCDSVRYLLSPSLARELSSIQELEIENFKLIEEIVVQDVEDEEKIDKLVLLWFFHGDLDFLSFVYFNFDECPKMEVLCCGTLCTPKRIEVILGDSESSI